ncbi:MAG: tRNA (adenosine(37)-N6)-threonylcarbamoyltransferase complex transferase subunit TsaD [Bdellovibrionales bacterium]|nr:tRNA (adenosine(37)-N6)-threonylcarbamoyltransferase complex transferase subunit TsaD [Bdellovibrionales bacterium]
MLQALGIETSCDDCSVSVVKENGELVFLSQKHQDSIHKKFGGIVPELASRHHEEMLLFLIDQALQEVPLSDIDVICVSNRPGLLGSLLVGCVIAKTLSFSWKKALIGVNHIEAHILSPLLFEKKKPVNSLKYPALAFVLSGGHSSLFYMRDIGSSELVADTRDDSAGEAFDKMARLLGFDWPGGPSIDKWAKKKSKTKAPGFFSKIKTDDDSFSFSGIKSQAQRLLSNKTKAWVQKNKAQICFDYQNRIVNHLMEKLDQVFEKKPVPSILLGGGVSANSLLRERLKKWSREKSVSCWIPEKKFCMDNAAMVAFTGLQYFLRGYRDDLNMICSPSHLEIDFFKNPVK